MSQSQADALPTSLDLPLRQGEGRRRDHVPPIEGAGVCGGCLATWNLGDGKEAGAIKAEGEMSRREERREGIRSWEGETERRRERK